MIIIIQDMNNIIPQHIHIIQNQQLSPLEKNISNFKTNSVSDYESFQLEGCNSINRLHNKAEMIQRSQKKNKKKQKIQKYLKSKQNESNHIEKTNLNSADSKLSRISDLLQTKQQQNIIQQQQMFINLFEQNPQLAISYLEKTIGQPTLKNIANFIFYMQKLDKTKLGYFFSKDNKITAEIFRQFCNIINFTDLEIDAAFRKIISKFKIPVQMEYCQRILWRFTEIYCQRNSEIYENVEEVYKLVQAVRILLQNCKKTGDNVMTMEQFIARTFPYCSTVDIYDLQQMYTRVVSQPIRADISYTQYFEIYRKNFLKRQNNWNKLGGAQTFFKTNHPQIQTYVYISKEEQTIYWYVKNKEYYIYFDDVIAIRLKHNLRKVQSSESYQTNNLDFDIETHKKILHLQAATIETKLQWIHFTLSIIKKNREKRIILLQNEHQSNWDEEQLKKLWKNQIFPKWDTLWDYKNKKPIKKTSWKIKFECLFQFWKRQNFATEFLQKNSIIFHSTLLETLWRNGLPPAIRNILWPIAIGNNLHINVYTLTEIKSRVKSIPKLHSPNFQKFIIQLAQLVLAFRVDIPPYKSLLYIIQTMCNNIKQNETHVLPKIILNFLYSYHFLHFYMSDQKQIWLRIQLFKVILIENCEEVYENFSLLQISPKIYFVQWMLSAFASRFSGQLLYRIWDNFILEGELFLFKVGITLIKYYEVELKILGFKQCMNLLKNNTQMSELLFFQILYNKIIVKEQLYQQYIEKYKQGVIKSFIQTIPLQQ